MPIHSLETQQNAGKLMWETQENFLSSPRKKKKENKNGTDHEQLLK